jgi:DNA modification methylase
MRDQQTLNSTASANAHWQQRLVSRQWQNVTLINADCRDVAPDLVYDVALTDPPYGIGKAEWDDQFPDWMWELLAPAKFCGVMPGVWNIPRCPQKIGAMKYNWTLAAHLVNGMTRGAVGFGNWIPCLLYTSAASLKASKAPEWCARFADWCESNGVTRKQLDAITGTSDMGGWWMSRLPHRAQIPTPAYWAKLKPALNAPDSFDADVMAEIFEADGDCKNFVVGRDDKPDHPSPKPLAPTQWFLQHLPGETVLDPFMGSGTTGVAAIREGRKFIGIEKDPKHYQTACERIDRELAQGVLLPANNH